MTQTAVVETESALEREVGEAADASPEVQVDPSASSPDIAKLSAGYGACSYRILGKVLPLPDKTYTDISEEVRTLADLLPERGAIAPADHQVYEAARKLGEIIGIAAHAPSLIEGEAGMKYARAAYRLGCWEINNRQLKVELKP